MAYRAGRQPDRPTDDLRRLRPSRSRSPPATRATSSRGLTGHSGSRSSPTPPTRSAVSRQAPVPTAAGAEAGAEAAGPRSLPTSQSGTASVQSLSVSPRSFRAAKAGASISAKVGAKVTYRLSAAASTKFTVQKESIGRKKGKKCVKPTKRNRRAKKCKLYKAVRGSFTHKGKAGSNSFKFTGRVEAKSLKPASTGWLRRLAHPSRASSRPPSRSSAGSGRPLRRLGARRASRQRVRLVAASAPRASEADCRHLAYGRGVRAVHDRFA